MNTFKHSLIILLAIFSFSACSTIRLHYQTELENKKTKEEKVFTYEKSYEIGGPHKTLCMFTGWFFGGYCWFYTVMPTVQQTQLITKDAQKRLDKLTDLNGFTTMNTKVKKVSWNQEETKFRLRHDKD